MKLASVMDAKGLSDRVHVRHFHSWCHRQLTAYGQTLPPQGNGFYAGLVDNVIRAVERSQIPGGQYQAVMLDEGHDFAPEWLKLVTQMVDPATNSLLVLYDDAQSIYERARSKQFSFKSVGVQAQGRTTILKINYRNTRQILQTASLVAADLLTADDQDDDGIPLLKPMSCGREGQAPVIIKLPTLRDEAFAIADQLASAHKEGFAWGDMAVLCTDYDTMYLMGRTFAQRKLPHRLRERSGDFNPGANAIQVMTMKVSKGLEFPVVALPGVGHMPAPGEDEKEAARVFYVAATRATQRLVVGVGGTWVIRTAVVYPNLVFDAKYPKSEDDMKYRESQIDKDLRQWFTNDLSKSLLRKIRLADGSLRGVNSLNIDLTYPITAFAGVNGAGKSTILAMACCAYHAKPSGYKLPKRKNSYYTFSDFFIQHTHEVSPQGVAIYYYIAHDSWKKTADLPEGKGIGAQVRRKNKGGKWNDYDARVHKCVVFLGIDRIVPHSERSQSRSYSRAFADVKPKGWENKVKDAVGYVLGKTYDDFRYLEHSKYSLPLVKIGKLTYSGFNMGAGENALFEIFSTIYSCGANALLFLMK